jgi:hypothetical protein
LIVFRNWEAYKSLQTRAFGEKLSYAVFWRDNDGQNPFIGPILASIFEFRQTFRKVLGL